MTPTPRGEVDDLLEHEESWPERTMLRAASAKECLATELPDPRSTNPGAQTRQPNTHDQRWTPRAQSTITRA
jgi:hypothetical protein